MSGKPQAVRALLAKLRHRGVVIALADGDVQVDGWKQLTPAERAELREEKERVVAWLESRELRRQRRAERKRKQQESVAIAERQQQRKVVGQIVNPGGPLRLLYADEVKPVPATARVIGRCPYGWLIGGE